MPFEDRGKLHHGLGTAARVADGLRIVTLESERQTCSWRSVSTASSTSGEEMRRGTRRRRRPMPAPGQRVSTIVISESLRPSAAIACSRVGREQRMDAIEHGRRLLGIRAQLPLTPPCRQADDDFLLDDDRQQQHRQRDDDGGGGERPPRELLEGQHVVDRDRQRSRLAPGEHRAEHEVVPREDERRGSCRR